MNSDSSLASDADLVRLTYISERAAPLTDDEVVELALAANRANRKNDITGCLWFGSSRFFQVLEGPRAAIDTLFARIQRDQRHTEVRLLSYALLDTRTFSRWGLAHLKHDDDESMSDLIHQYAGVVPHPSRDKQEHSTLRQLIECFASTLRQRMAS
jgi:hypothetical protein